MFGQQDTSYRYKCWGVLGGIHYQKNVFAELGVGNASYGMNGHHNYWSSWQASCEFMLSEKAFVVGPKLALRSTGGLSAGLNVANYTDFKESCFVIRPDVGIGLFQYALLYGYNFKLVNRDFQYVNRHTFSFIILFCKNKLRDP